VTGLLDGAPPDDDGDRLHGAGVYESTD
jgi:hypothetical protein